MAPDGHTPAAPAGVMTGTAPAMVWGGGYDP